MDSTDININSIMDTIHNEYRLNLPKHVGKYCINNEFHIHFTKKPSWFHRKMTKLLLGWVWEDYG